MLLFPLELDIVFPSLEVYIDNSATVGDKKMAINTYLHLCAMFLQLFKSCYGADSLYFLEKKSAYESGIFSKKAANSKKLKQFNREAKNQDANRRKSGKKV